MNPWLFLLTLSASGGDLWSTPDQQASRLFNAGQFSAAEHRFTNKAWQASAAFRAQDYSKASELFGQLQHADGFYNQGNALAFSGAYEQALLAYNQSLALRPKDADTLYNRELIKALLNKKEQNKPQKNKPQEDKPKKNKPKKDNDKDKHNENKPQPNSAKDTNPTPVRNEKDEENQHWLQLVADEPGSLLREKFLRDHLRRMQKEER